MIRRVRISLDKKRRNLRGNLRSVPFSPFLSAGVIQKLETRGKTMPDLLDKLTRFEGSGGASTLRFADFLISRGWRGRASIQKETLLATVVVQLSALNKKLSRYIDGKWEKVWRQGKSNR